MCKIIRHIIIIIVTSYISPLIAQECILDLHKEYEAFKRQTQQDYSNYRKKLNKEYSDYLRKSWEEYSSFAPIRKPQEKSFPPKPYQEDENQSPIVVNPTPVKPIEITPQPKPFKPIKENAKLSEQTLNVQFYGIAPIVQVPNDLKILITAWTPEGIAAGWDKLVDDGLNNTIRDCLETRIRYSLCDWAYLRFLDSLSTQYCSDRNSATLFMAFLYCQSGYQMRLAIDGTSLYMLYGSRHQIFDKGYFNLDGQNFYPYGEPSNSIQICNAKFEGETPMSLYIATEQIVGDKMSTPRRFVSKSYGKVTASACVPEKLIDLYNEYPTSAIDNNPMTRWAMYANVPLAQKTKDILYPTLRDAIKNDNTLIAANKLLNWVQTGFVYEYDDKIWGRDRAFFAEETLYYPYCDCEDRSILFSRLVRDLLGLDVALIYYPGHLATAVCFNEEVKGDAMIINDRKFIVCDPTYIGAPVGAQMPDLEYDKTEAIILNR